MPIKRAWIFLFFLLELFSLSLPSLYIFIDIYTVHFLQYFKTCLYSFFAKFLDTNKPLLQSKKRFFFSSLDFSSPDKRILILSNQVASLVQTQMIYITDIVHVPELPKPKPVVSTDGSKPEGDDDGGGFVLYPPKPSDPTDLDPVVQLWTSREGRSHFTEPTPPINIFKTIDLFLAF